MVDLSAIGGMLASLNAAKDVAQTMMGLRDAAAFQGKMLEFQSKILDAQNAALLANDERSALVEKVRQLEEQMARLKAWETEKERYALTEIARGVFIYLLKPEARGTDPLHGICANCYQSGKKSILQIPSTPYALVHLKCSTCNADITADSGEKNFPFKY